MCNVVEHIFGAMVKATGYLFSCFCAPVFPNVPSQPGMPCQGEDSEYLHVKLRL